MNPDQKIVQTVVLAIAAVAVIGIIGQFALAYFGKTIPESFSMLATAALAALGALLASTRGRGAARENGEPPKPEPPK